MLSVAVITAPRPIGANYFPDTVQSLKRAGFDEIGVFNDTHRDGPYRNWKRALRQMVETDQSDAYLIFQDDVKVAAGLRDWLDTELPTENVGVISLYTAKPNIASEPGWHKLNVTGEPPSEYLYQELFAQYHDLSSTGLHGVPQKILSVISRYDSYFVESELDGIRHWHHILHEDGKIVGTLCPRPPYCVGYGALAYLMPHDSAVAFLKENIRPESRNMIEMAVAQWCFEAEKDYWMHTPSLVEHIGIISSQSRPPYTKPRIDNGFRMAECFCEDVAELKWPTEEEVVYGKEDAKEPQGIITTSR